MRNIFILLLTLLASCSSFKGERVDPNDAEMIDDAWNDTDARLVAEEMIKEMLEQPWYGEFLSGHKGDKPIVIVSRVDNRTDEPYLDVKSLTDEIRTALVKSRKIRFIDKGVRGDINEEMQYQHGGNVDPATARQLGKQLGAHFLLTGDVSVSIQTNKKQKIKAYQVTLNLTNLESSEIEWSQNKKIKKKFKY